MPIGGIRFLLLAALAQVALPSTSAASIDFHFTSDAVLQQGVAAATAQWTARCLDGGAFADFAKNFAPDQQMEVAARQAQTAKFDRAEFVRVATDAWRTANAALPQGPLRVCVDLVPTADGFTRDLMGGVAAVTAGEGRIILRIHPDANWQRVLPYAIAHEMHHSYWVGRHFDPARPFTLADYLVLEGRADYFAGTLFTSSPPWITALDAAAYETAWRAVSKELNSTEWGTLQAVMFGAPQAGIPMWAGYSIGFRLVSNRMARAPQLDLAAMTAAPASEFIPPLSSK